MMHRRGALVALACSALFNGACGNTTKNPASTDTSDSSTDEGASATNVTGSGGSSTQGVTVVGTTGSTTGTGGTTSSVCPSFEPAAGSTCPEEAQVCVFENCQAPDYNDRHQLTCLGGAWTLTALTTCDAGSCPEGGTLPGSACDEDFTPGPCTYVDACSASYEVMCIDGTWRTSVGEDADAPERPAPPVPECPLYPPYLGDPCCPTAVPEVCDYTMDGTDGAAGASFIIIPTTDTDTGGGAAEPPPTLSCAVCSPQMTWTNCPLPE